MSNLRVFMQIYTKKVIITCIVFVLLFMVSSFFHKNHFDVGVAAIAILWLISVIYLFIINLTEFKTKDLVKLNIFNALLTGLMLLLFFTQANQEFRGLFSFMPIPSFALIPSIIRVFSTKPASAALN